VSKLNNFLDHIRDIYNNRISTKENKVQIRKICNLIIFIFIVFFIAEIYIGINTTNTLNDYFSIKYENEMKPKSEMEINKIVTEVSPIYNITEKLNKIAEWETNNFTDLFWEKYLKHDIKIKSFNPPIGSYSYENTGKIRATFPSPYANDPYWIQYNKFGACGEEATLFANVTNRSGYVTRMMAISTGYWFYGIPIPLNNHAWVEVKINDEWYYFDPTVYGEYNVLKIDAYKDRWFGKPENYDLFSPDQVLSINQLDTQEDASQRYPKMVSPYLNSYNILW
jgi:hypothetical protein